MVPAMSCYRVYWLEAHPIVANCLSICFLERVVAENPIKFIL
jgi:hypothetical protein